MRFLYYVGFGNWWGAYPPNILDQEEGPTVGGGENCALRTAAGLVELGHEVVYCSVGQPGEWRGVRFASQADAFRIYDSDGPWDAMVAWSVTRPLRAALRGEGRVMVQQLNDLLFEPGWHRYVDVVGPASDNHSAYLQSLLPPDAVGACKWSPVSNGVEPAYFPEAPPIAERPPWVGYWSSPDRGLHHLLEVWPRIHAQVPEARLRVYYQVNKFIDSVLAGGVQGPWGRAVYLATLLRKRLDELQPLGVDLIDAIPRRALAKEQTQCRVLTYPLDPQGYTEGFGQAVPEGLLAGCLPVVRCTDAFADLWAPYCWTLNEHPASPEFHDEIVDKTVRGLRGECPEGVPPPEKRRAYALEWSWLRSARALEKAAKLAIEWRRERPADPVEQRVLAEHPEIAV